MSSAPARFPRSGWLAVGRRRRRQRRTRRACRRSCRSRPGCSCSPSAVAERAVLPHARRTAASRRWARRRPAGAARAPRARRRRRPRRCPTTRGRGPRSSSPSGRRGTATRSRGCACSRTAARSPVAATLPGVPRRRAPATSSRWTAGCGRRRTTTRTATTSGGPARRARLDARALDVRSTRRRRASSRSATPAATPCSARLPEPEAGLAAGHPRRPARAGRPVLAADFATAGVSHVVAISGWNIAIVAGLVGGRAARSAAAARDAGDPRHGRAPTSSPPARRRPSSGRR